MARKNETVKSLALKNFERDFVRVPWGEWWLELDDNCFELYEGKHGWAWFITYSDGVCIANYNVSDVMGFASVDEALADMKNVFASGLHR